MDYGDYYWGLYRDYYRDPFPLSLRSARQMIQKAYHDQWVPPAEQLRRITGRMHVAIEPGELPFLSTASNLNPKP